MPQYTLQADKSFTGGIPPPPYKLDESMVDRIDPEYAQFFKEHMTERSDLLYTHRTPLATTRSGGNVMPGQSPLSECAKIFDIAIPRTHTEAPKPVPARVFVPKGEAPTEGWPLFIWFHGGGWVLGNITTENSYCTKMCNLAKCVVVSVDYRLAPEDPFPAAVHDSFEALLYAYEKAPTDLGTNPKKVAIGGSSAGGNLTAVTTHKFVNSPLSQGLAPLLHQVLVVPVTDNSATPETMPSWGENALTPQLSAEKMIWYRYLYLTKEEDIKNPESSPLFYSDESFAKVPPCIVAAADCDVLRSEAEAYHQKLVKNGVQSKLVIYEGCPHPVMAMDGVLSKGVQLINDTTDAVRNSFYN